MINETPPLPSVIPKSACGCVSFCFGSRWYGTLRCGVEFGIWCVYACLLSLTLRYHPQHIITQHIECDTYKYMHTCDTQRGRLFCVYHVHYMRRPKLLRLSFILSLTLVDDKFFCSFVCALCTLSVSRLLLIKAQTLRVSELTTELCHMNNNDGDNGEV